MVQWTEAPGRRRFTQQGIQDPSVRGREADPSQRCCVNLLHLDETVSLPLKLSHYRCWLVPQECVCTYICSQQPPELLSCIDCLSQWYALG